MMMIDDSQLCFWVFGPCQSSTSLVEVRGLWKGNREASSSPFEWYRCYYSYTYMSSLVHHTRPSFTHCFIMSDKLESYDLVRCITHT